MTLAAKLRHEHLNRPLNDFTNKTAALTISYAARDATIWTNHFDGQKYHHFPLIRLHPSDSEEAFQKARRIIRNVQDWAYDRDLESLNAIKSFEGLSSLPEGSVHTHRGSHEFEPFSQALDEDAEDS